MRILLTTDYYWPYKGGGVEVVVKQLAERLVRKGHDVMVLTLRLRNASPIEQINGVDIHRLASAEMTSIVRMQLSVPLAPWQALSAIRHFKPDLIHIHNRFYTTSVLARLAKGRIPSIFTLHLGPVSMGKGVSIYENLVSRRLLRGVNMVTAVSDWASQVWPKCRVIPNGVDIEIFHPQSTNSDRKNVLCVGRLIKNKGPQRLIEAIPYINSDIGIIFVGDGPMRKELEVRADKLGVTSRVEFLGETPEVYSHISGALALVRASDTEGMSLCVLEALSSGIPVVASRVAAGDMVKDNVNGFVLEQNSPSLIANRINLLSSNKDLWLKLSEKARLTAENYSWDKCVDQYEDAYQSVVTQQEKVFETFKSRYRWLRMGG